MRAIELVLGVLCVAGVSVAESPGPGRARVLQPLAAMQTQGVGVQALSVRAVEVGGDVPAFGVLPVTSPVGGEVGEWRGMAVEMRPVSVEALPAREKWDAWAPWTSMRDVQVSELTLSAGGVEPGLRAFEPMRLARGTTAGWDLVPFPVARHSRMGDLRVAANAAEAQGDAEESERLRREFLRVAGITEARREAFAGRPQPSRGGAADER